MRWDKSWEDGGRGVCPDSRQHLNSHSPEALTHLPCTPPRMQAHLNPIQAAASAAALHIFTPCLLIAPLSRSSLLSILLLRAVSLFFFLAVSYSTQGQSPADVSRNGRLHKHAHTICRLREASGGVELIFMQGVHHRCW